MRLSRAYLTIIIRVRGVRRRREELRTVLRGGGRVGVLKVLESGRGWQLEGESVHI